MSHDVRLVLPADVHDELVGHYKGKEKELRKFIFDQLRPLAKQAKLTKINRQLQVNIPKNGRMEPKVYDFKDNEVHLEDFKIPEDPEWVPEKMSKDECKSYVLKVSDRIWDNLMLFGQIFGNRIEIHNSFVPKDDKEYDKKTGKPPKCLEQAVYEGTAQGIMQHMASNIDKEFDEEFNEMEKSYK